MEKFKRNENGMVEGVDYPIGEDGLINWFKLIKPQHLVLNKQYQAKLEKKYGGTLLEIQNKMQAGEIEVDDNFKLILLQGLKDLCFLRGYKSVTYPFTHVDGSGVYSRCQIVWIPNEESPIEETFEDGADATTYNTTNFAQQYLTTISLNRSFVRTVRNFLRIPTLGFDEIGPNKEGVDTTTVTNTKTRNSEVSGEQKTATNYGVKPQSRVEKAADEITMSFETLKKKAIASKYENAEKWEGYSDIPDKICMKLIAVLKKLKNK